jgi:hypothetical protein
MELALKDLKPEFFLVTSRAMILEPASDWSSKIRARTPSFSIKRITAPGFSGAGPSPRGC